MPPRPQRVTDPGHLVEWAAAQFDGLGLRHDRAIGGYRSRVTVGEDLTKISVKAPA